MLNGFNNFLFPIDPSRRWRKKNAQVLNRRAYENWFVYLTRLYLNQFEWENMPDTVNVRILEESLFYNGNALFFKDPTMGYMALPCAGHGQMNVYFEYVEFRAISNQYSKVYSNDESVLVRDNQLMYPAIWFMESWASQIADAGRTIDVYAKAMKRPWLVTVSSKDDELTSRVVLDEIEQNEIAIVADKRIGQPSEKKAYSNPNDGQSLTSIWTHKRSLLDEALTFIGINNANTDKKERLITSEVESNNQLIAANTDAALDWRIKACTDINKMFGLNISVRRKHNYTQALESFTEQEGHTPKGSMGVGVNG